MTLFEYLAAGYILMLSFAVLRAMSGVPYAVQTSRRYWVHTLWLVAGLAFCLVAFWAFWPYREVEWTIFKFTNTLAIPALLYAHTSVLVPPDPSAVDSWRDYFFAVRLPLFATGTAFMAMVTVSNQLTLGVAPLHPSQLGNYLLVGMYAAGLFSAKPKVHVVLAVVPPTLIAVYFFTLLTTPDSIFG